MAISNSVVAVDIDIICYRGDDFTREIEFFQDEAHTIDLDITDDRFDLHVIKSPATKSTPLLSFSTDGPVDMVFSGINKLVLTKTALEMELKAGKYTYDLQRTLANGTIITVQQGIFQITDDKTQLTS